MCSPAGTLINLANEWREIRQLAFPWDSSNERLLSHNTIPTQKITVPLPKKGHVSFSCQSKLWLWDTLSESVKKQQNKIVAPTCVPSPSRRVMKLQLPSCSNKSNFKQQVRGCTSFSATWTKVMPSKTRVSALLKLSQHTHYHGIWIHLCFGILLIEKSHCLSMLHLSCVPFGARLLLGKQKAIKRLMSGRCVFSFVQLLC